MSFTIWVGIAGTLVALFFLINAYRNLRVSITGHAANAARIHIPMAIAFIPAMWMAIVIMNL